MDTSQNNQLMYSQYMDVNETNRVCGLLESKKEKPSMKFTKSAVLSRVMKLIPQMKEAEADLDDKSDLNIEVCNDDEPFVEMDVALIDEQDGDQNVDICYEQDESEDEESDLESSKVQNTLDLIKDEIEPMLDPSIKIYSKSDSQPKIAIPLVTQEPEVNQEVQPQALMPDEESSEFAMQEDQSAHQELEVNHEVQQQAWMPSDESR